MIVNKNIAFYILSTIVLIGCSNSYNSELLFINPEGNDGFAYPYFLYLPEHVSQKETVFMVIEPNNTGFVDDDFKKHIDKARRTASRDFYLGNYVAQNLNYPLLVPVFPRPESDWKIYTHALDRDVMVQKGNSLERIDIQLIEMFKHARQMLLKKNIKTNDKFLLTGFSASGTFANRFTLIHPDQVYATAAGGLNGLLMLPFDSLNNEILKYPVGVGDFKELTNTAFDKQLFLNTPQFYFMGGADSNDAVPYGDAFDKIEREQIYRLLGEQMQAERWERCKNLYIQSQVNAIIKTYDQTGHEHPTEIKNEVVDFFRACINNN